MKISNEFKTGVFVLICLAALFALLIKVGNFSFFKKGYVIHTRFQYTGGVKTSSPVRLSGVDVGEVRGIRLLHEATSTQAEVDLWLVEGTKVRKDAVAIVATLGMMGEKYIEIRAGVSPDFVTAGDVLQSEEPVRLEDLIDLGKKIGEDIGQTARDISKVANHVDETIQENRPKIDTIFDNLEETSENFNDFSQDVKYHPWKVLARGKEASREQMLRDREAKRLEKARQRGKTYTPVVPVEEPVAATASAASKSKQQNFGPGR